MIFVGRSYDLPPACINLLFCRAWSPPGRCPRLFLDSKRREPALPFEVFSRFPPFPTDSPLARPEKEFLPKRAHGLLPTVILSPERSEKGRPSQNLLVGSVHPFPLGPAPVSPCFSRLIVRKSDRRQCSLDAIYLRFCRPAS